MSLKSNLRSLLPPGVWEALGFCKRIPVHWRLDRNDSRRVRRGISGLPLFVTPDVFVLIPENLTAFLCWRIHAIEDPASSLETSDFLELAQGRRALIDIGAQTGFLSALFARSRTGATRILSFEPDPQVHSILERARQLNTQSGTDWVIRHEAVSNATESLLIPISNSLYEPPEGRIELGTRIKVQSRTLAEVVQALDWTPDILKIDVESFEHEILTAALPVLEKIKPALQLEVHWEFLQSRGLSARDFLSPLADLGYRGIRRRYRGFAEWNRAGARESVSRLSLLPG